MWDELFDDKEEADDERGLAEKSKKVMTVIGDIKIVDEESFKLASSYAKMIKDIKDRINAYWNPTVKKTHETHKALKDKQNAMLKPTEDADKMLRDKISAWATEQEMKRRRMERELEEAAEKERKRLIEEAKRCEDKGDVMGALEAEEQAAMVPTPHAERAETKAEGISFVTDYDIEVVGEVPVSFNGTTLRPVDLSAVKTLIKLNPKVQIPGIKVTEKLVPRVR